MLVDIIWNALGIFCIYLMLKIFQRAQKNLRRKKLKNILNTFFIGIISGVIGVLLGVFAFEHIDAAIRIYPTNSALFIARVIFISIFLVFCAYVAGHIAKMLLYKFCCKEVTIDIAIFIPLLVISQPIVYGWFMRVRAMLY
jgi:hypothetical protein